MIDFQLQKQMKKHLQFTILALVFCFQLSAQSVSQLIDGYLEAVGGIEVLDEIEGMKMTGKMKISGLEFPFTQVIFKDGRQYSEIVYMGNVLKQRVYDGQHMWSINMATQQAEYDSEESVRNAELDFNDFPDALYGYEEKGYAFRIEGKEEKFDTQVYKLKVRKEDRFINGDKVPDIVYYYLDVESKISVGQETIEVDSEGNEVISIMQYGDYDDVGDGYMVPHYLSQSVNGETTFEMIVTKVEINPIIDDQEFVFPGK